MNRLLLAAALLLLVLPASAGAVVPGQNGRIAFDSDHDDYLGDIYSVEPDGTGLLRLTSTKNYEGDPAWSPDGQKIAYIRAQDLWVMNADGSDQHKVANFKPDLRDPGWSPNGQRLIFATESRGEDIWTIKADGSKPRQVTKTKQAEFQPSWSPTGKRIAFVRERTEVYRIVTANPDGSKQKVPMPKFHDTQLGPNWAPNGRQLTFYDVDTNIYVVKADGTGRRRVKYGSSPAFSPDGKLMAVADLDEESESGPIRVRNLADLKDTKASPFPNRDSCDNPDWQALGPPAGG